MVKRVWRRQSSAGALHLLKTQELHDRQIYTGVKSQSALVWPDGLVELNAEAAVHLDVACGN